MGRSHADLSGTPRPSLPAIQDDEKSPVEDGMHGFPLSADPVDIAQGYVF